MKRFHVHVSVNDLGQSTEFYSQLFGSPPTLQKPGYAKWMLDDPRINFAISTATGQAGIEHLGLQTDSDTELDEVHGRMVEAGAMIKDEKSANCCYAVSDKHWTVDPQGIVWEAFHTLGEAKRFGDDHGLSAAEARRPAAAAASCCGAQAAGCC